MWGLEYQTCGVIATVIGLVAMAGVILFTLARRNRAVFERAARLPLAVDGTAPRGATRPELEEEQR